jgi:hypothetical protein
MGKPTYNKIVFALPAKVHDNDYHKVKKTELKGTNTDTDTMIRCVQEMNARVTFARKYYKGKYDQRHRHWMKTLTNCMDLSHKLELSLDALVATGK